MTRALLASALLLLFSCTLIACGGGSTSADPTPPTITGVEPASGGVAGGHVILIKGQGLANDSVGANEVLIGGNPADEITVLDDQTITCRTPPGTVGPANVSVTKNNGTAVLADGFQYYPAPTFLSIAPDEGTRLGGTPVTIKGAGFLSNNPVQTIALIGLKELVDPVIVDDETITGRTPTSFTEVPKDVTVVNNNGQAVEPLGFKYFGPTPQILQVIPNQGPAGGGQLVTLKGQYFTLNGGVLTVTFGSIQAADVTRIDDQTVECITPSGPPAEFVDVSIGNVNGISTLSNGYYNIPPPPTITGLNPNRGVMTDNTPVTITGTGFVNYGAGTNTVTIGAVAATNVVAVNDTTITCVAPSVTSPQFVSVSVTNTHGSATLVNGFEYFLPPMWSAVGSCGGGGLSKIDTSTWTATTVGSLSTGMTGIAVDPSTNTLYGWGDSCSGRSLYTINQTTGAATAIGGSLNTADITIGPSGSSWKLYGYDFYAYNIVEINKASGATTTIAYSCCGWYSDGFAVDANGNGYFAYGYTLYGMNMSTGARTTIGNMGRPMQCMTFHQGTLYGNERYGSEGLYSISTSSGAVASLMTLPSGTDALASGYP